MLSLRVQLLLLEHTGMREAVNDPFPPSYISVQYSGTTRCPFACFHCSNELRAGTITTDESSSISYECEGFAFSEGSDPAAGNGAMSLLGLRSVVLSPEYHRFSSQFCGSERSLCCC